MSIKMDNVKIKPVSPDYPFVKQWYRMSADEHRIKSLQEFVLSNIDGPFNMALNWFWCQISI